MDPYFANPETVCQLRYAFLLEALRDLDTQLKGVGSRLYVVRGSPQDKLPDLIRYCTSPISGNPMQILFVGGTCKRPLVCTA